MVMVVVDQVVDVFGTRRKAAAYEKVVDPFFRFSVRVWAGLCVSLWMVRGTRIHYGSLGNKWQM